MFFAYVVRSVNAGHLYKGHCENLEERLKQHNSGMTESIRMYIPFELAYFEEFESRPEAIKREKYFKSAAGRRFLKSKLPRFLKLTNQESSSPFDRF
jgi:putative endonuclease